MKIQAFAGGVGRQQEICVALAETLKRVTTIRRGQATVKLYRFEVR